MKNLTLDSTLADALLFMIENGTELTSTTVELTLEGAGLPPLDVKFFASFGIDRSADLLAERVRALGKELAGTEGTVVAFSTDGEGNLLPLKKSDKEDA